METGKSILENLLVTSKISHKDRVFFYQRFFIGKALVYVHVPRYKHHKFKNIQDEKPFTFVRPLVGWCIYVKPTQQKGTKSSQINPEMSQNLSPSAFWRHLAPFPSPDHSILDTPTLSSWWFQPIWKILVKLDHFPKWGWTQKIFETTTQLFFLAIFAFWPRWHRLFGGRTAWCVKVSKSERFETSMTLQSFPLHPNGYTPEFTNMTLEKSPMFK